MRSKLRVFISSVKDAGCVDESKICRYCGPRHNAEIINRELKRFRGTGSLLSTEQRDILQTAQEFCQDNDVELEVVDMSNLGLLDKMKLLFKGVRAPAIYYRGHQVEGTPSKEKLEVLLHEKT